MVPLNYAPGAKSAVVDRLFVAAAVQRPKTLSMVYISMTETDGEMFQNVERSQIVVTVPPAGSSLGAHEARCFTGVSRMKTCWIV